MILYHGTTDGRARRICAMGFLPRKPSRRVWFAESRKYALGRAKTQARRSKDRPVVLTCDIDLDQLRRRLGSRRVFHKNRVIAINGKVPVSVLRSHPAAVLRPTTPEELARWVNQLLGLKPHKGAGRTHPGIERLSRWIVNRYRTQPNSEVSFGEIVRLAEQWLPEYFEGVEVDLERLTSYRKVKQIEVEVDEELAETDIREEEALDCLTSGNARRRVRGLRILAEDDVPDLFDWCVMHLDDRSKEMQVAALRIMRQCEQGEPDVILPLAESDDKRIRGAAIAALGRHAGDDASRWLERGFKDPSPCVRVEAATLLPTLDPAEHHAVFELARHDPNPRIARQAQRLTEGKGYQKL